MFATVRSFTLDGISAHPVRVEVDVHRGLPGFTIVGLHERDVSEIRERVRAALINSGFEFPLRRIVVNIAPASVRRTPSPGLDLPIAAALLLASGQLDPPGLAPYAVVGELALDGSVRAVNGAIAFAEKAHQEGAEMILVPLDNAPEAALAPEIGVVGVDSLARLVALVSGDWTPPRPVVPPLALEPGSDGPDLADLRGQPDLHRALEVAAAGEHGLLLVGPPGSGKSLAAARLPSILPPLTPAQARELITIASACGRLAHTRPARPFRAPHHTISPAGLIGGSFPLRPGEVTLAHRGVLFLDDLGEFRDQTLKALNGPLGTGVAVLARAGVRRELPSRFLLIAAAGRCPCGRGKGDPDYTCPPLSRRRYRNCLKGALSGHIDIQLDVSQPTPAAIGAAPAESSAAVRDRVTAARALQERRLGAERCNAHLTPGEARALPIEDSARALLEKAAADLRFDTRDYRRALGLAQTIADLAALDSIHEREMTEALDLLRRT